MFKIKNSINIDLAVSLILVLFAYGLRNQAYITSDTAWHIEGAKRLLAGGNYLLNTFDTNAPFVFVYFFPVIWLKKIIPLSLPHLFNVYVLFTNLLSLTLIYYLLSHVLKNNTLLVKRFLFYCFVYIILFLPVYSYGHREIVLMNLYLPYFTLIMLATTYPEDCNIPVIWKYILALFGAFGILQNIFYLGIPILIDIYRYLKLKKFCRYQQFFYVTVLLNILSIFYFYPEYLKKIVPMVLCYESGFNFPLWMILLESLTIICLLSLILVMTDFKKIYHSDDILICFIAATCALLIYIFEYKQWYYHQYPALCFVVLILGLIITKFYEEQRFSKSILPRITLFSFSVACGMLATIFVIIIGFYLNEIAVYRDPNSVSNTWINYTDRHFRNKKVYFLVIQLGPAYLPPIYSKAHVTPVSPWSNPWVLPYVLQNKNNSQILNKRCHLNKDLIIFRRLAGQALVLHNPDFIILEVLTPDLKKNVNFNYFQFFSADQQFAAKIKQYVFYDRFGPYEVYKRINE